MATRAAAVLLCALVCGAAAAQLVPLRAWSARQELAPARVCTSAEEGEVCCRECARCLTPEPALCVRGEVACVCAPFEACVMTVAAWDAAAEALACRTAAEECADVVQEYNGECPVCEDGPDETYACGEDCGLQPAGRAQALADCVLPGNCTTTHVVTRDCGREGGQVCRVVTMHDAPVCEDVQVVDCTRGATEADVCVDFEVPAERCVTTPVFLGEECETVSAAPGDDRAADEVCVDGVYTERNCSTTFRTETFDCAVVARERPCTLEMVPTKVCSEYNRLPDLPEDCWYSYSPKCQRVESTKEVCPTEQREICTNITDKVVVEGSCKPGRVPCLAFPARNAAGEAGTAASRVSSLSVDQDCVQEGIVCDYSYLNRTLCGVRDVPIEGAPCKQVPTTVEECESLDTPQVLCKSRATASPPTTAAAPVTETGPGVDFVQPNVAPNFLLDFARQVLLVTPERQPDCEIVPMPTADCSNTSYVEEVCNTREVPVENCTVANIPTRECRLVPRQAPECENQAEVTCRPQLGNETRCETNTATDTKCRQVPQETCECATRTFRQCRSGASRQVEVCDRVEEDPSSPCSETIESKTTCADPEPSQCLVDLPTTVAPASTGCPPKFCTRKGETVCRTEPCKKSRITRQCTPPGTPVSCIPGLRPTCPDNNCTRSAVRCIVNSCGEQECFAP